jgi:hypothetical protein
VVLGALVLELHGSADIILQGVVPLDMPVLREAGGAVSLYLLGEV